MILIADSGSTKTDWVLWNSDNDQIHSFKTIGLNPYFVNSQQVTEVVAEVLKDFDTSAVEKVYFYGSGCASKESIATLRNGLKPVCAHSEIFIDHDLMAAARALFANKKGIACIIGTGSNACLYDGNKITKEAVSYGYIMGDEGSGNHLGRLLLKSIFSKRAPQEIIDAFRQDYPQVDLSYLLEELYHSDFPNRFLAGFSPFLYKYKKEDFIRGLIAQSFSQFIDEFVMDLMGNEKYPISFQGSIAYLYQDILEEVLQTKGLVMGSIIKEPITPLLSYHRRK